MKVAVVGATGMVGQVMLKVLEERNFPLSELLPVASARSEGSSIRFRGMDIPVMGIEQALNLSPDLVLFSAGGSVSLEWAPRFVERGSTVVDNSSAWRMDPSKKLLVPEINGDLLGEHDRLIANPNCSTIQLVMALAPLHKAYTAQRVVVSTYQSVTGTGVQAVKQLEDERAGREAELVYPYRIDGNVIPRCDEFLPNGYTKEEMKVVAETQKILGEEIKVTCTAVRVPVTGGHSEAVNVQFEKPFELEEVKRLIATTPGLLLVDDPANDRYPMPLEANGRDEVLVGRLRRDESQPNTLNMWVVADNLRKGAATNTVQIAELLVAKGILSVHADTRT